MLFLIFFVFFNFYLCGSDLAKDLNEIVKLDSSLFVNKNAFEIYNKFGIYGVVKYFLKNKKKISISAEKLIFYKKYENLEGEIETLIENYPKYLVFSFGEKKVKLIYKNRKSEFFLGLKDLKIFYLKDKLRELNEKNLNLEKNNKDKEGELKQFIIKNNESLQLKEPLIIEKEQNKSWFKKYCCCYFGN